MSNFSCLCKSLWRAGGVSSIACDGNGLLASGDNSGVVSLTQTGKQKPDSLCLLPPCQHLMPAMRQEPVKDAAAGR